MPSIDVTVSCPVHDSFRVEQVAGMFDVPLAERASERFAVELPDASENWQIGLIVGPSGSGKSTVAREAWGGGRVSFATGDLCHLSEPPVAKETRPLSLWPADRAVIDCFGDLPTRRIVNLFTAVGFGSPPAWIKPYAVLSGGERFRCDLARALSVCRKAEPTGTKFGLAADAKPLVVFDEFTSVVDRNVAKVCSAAIAKGIRRGHLPCRFVAVTCHYDVAEWLEPDWVLDMATTQLERRRLRRPAIEVEIHRCRRSAWQMFKRHHYLSGSLAPAARCYLATWRGVPVHFCATLPLVGKRNHRRFTRIVTLPDYQGIGIGMRVVAAVAELHRTEGLRINVTSSHPALVRHCTNSPLWKAVNVMKAGSRTSRSRKFTYRGAVGRAMVSFEYIGA